MNALKGNITRLDHYLDRAIQRFGSLTAIESSGVVLNYHEFGKCADEITASLREFAVRGGEPVVVIVNNQPGDLSAYLAVWRCGAVAVPLHLRAGAKTVRYVFETTEARLVIDNNKQLEGTVGLLLSDARKLGRVSCLSRPSPDPETILDGAALMVFTSGTTGDPKGVVLGHSGYCGKLGQFDSVIPMREGMRTLQALQLTFSFGQWTSLLTLAKGGIVDLTERFNPESILLSLASKRVDWFPVVPSMMRLLLRALGGLPQGAEVRARLAETGSPGIFMSGGEPLAGSLGSEIRRLFPKSGVADVYGLTETNSADFILKPEEYNQSTGTIGRPSPGVEYKIALTSGDPASPGEVGELWVNTPYVMRGYFKNEAASAACRCGRFLKTGDMALVNKRGLVRLVGRNQDIISRAGNKISPLELEDVICAHPAVAAAAAVGLPDAMLGEAIHVMVVRKRGMRLDDEEVRNWVGTSLEKYKIPDGVHLVDALPQGGTGKLNRKAVRTELSDLIRGAIE